MPIIKPISDLKNKSAEISALAKSANEPIFLTKNGEGDLVVMSIEYYHAEQKRQELVQKLTESTLQYFSGAERTEHETVFQTVFESLKK